MIPNWFEFILIIFNLFFGSGFLRLVWLRKQQNEDNALSITLQAAQAQNEDYWLMQKQEKSRLATLEQEFLKFSGVAIQITSFQSQIAVLKQQVKTLENEREESLLKSNLIKKAHDDEILKIRKEFEKRANKQQETIDAQTEQLNIQKMVINNQAELLAKQAKEISTLKSVLKKYTQKITSLLPHDNDEAIKLIDELNSIFS